MVLEEHFGKENAPRAYKLKRNVTTIQKGDMSIYVYYTKFRSVWDEIQSTSPTPSCDCNGSKCDVNKDFTKIRGKERLYEFLMRLNDEYNAVKIQILSSTPI